MNKYWEGRTNSFDIETWGLDPILDQENLGIWSLGLDSPGKEGIEKFTHSHLGPDETIDAMKVYSPEFGQKQFTRGSFDAYKASIKAGTTERIEDITTNLFKQIDQNGAILIQNLNFENKMMEAVLDKMDLSGNAADIAAAEEIRGGMRFSQSFSPNKILYRPPTVTEQLNKARSSHSAFLSGGNSNDWNNTVTHFDKMMEAYAAEFNEKKEGRFVVDLMDITKATFAKAADQGFLDKSHVSIGTSINFLSQMMQMGEESHTSLKDAKDQQAIYSRLMGVYHELSSGGKLSDETEKLLANIRLAQPDEAKRHFLSALQRADEDITKIGHTRINLDTFALRHSVPVDVNEKNIEKPHIINVASHKDIDSYEEGSKEANLYRTSSNTEAYEDVKRRFQNVKIGGTESLDELIARHTAGNVKSEERLAKEIPYSANAKIGSSIDKASIFGKFSKNEKIIGAIAGIGLVGGLLSLTGTASDKDIQKRQKVKNNNTVSRAVKQFDTPDLNQYHGSSLQDYNERKKHHQY